MSLLGNALAVFGEEQFYSRSNIDCLICALLKFLMLLISTREFRQRTIFGLIVAAYAVIFAKGALNAPQFGEEVAFLFALVQNLFGRINRQYRPNREGDV